MTTITKLEAKTFQGKVTGHSVILSDGTVGYLDDKASDKDLKEGESVISSLAVKQNRQGKDYNLLTLKRAITPKATPPEALPIPPPTVKTMAVPGKSIEQHKVEAAVSATEFVTSMFNAERIDWPKFKETQRECVQLLWDEIDEIFGNKR